ncbi:MAG: serpin family protein [Bacteroidaceae bacterium]|nr:serpin family protein [Bacteroidaceae bacterium]
MKRQFILSSIFCLSLSAAAQEASSINTHAFAFNLMEQLEKQCDAEDKNLVFSPLSAWMALSMLQNGAAGNTLTEMQQAMCTTDYTAQHLNEYNQQLMSVVQRNLIPEWMTPEHINYNAVPSLESANSIWSDTGFPFLPSFYDVNTKYYDAYLQTLDLSEQESMDQIDAWVNEATHGAIPSIKMLPNDMLRMILINTIYFKGGWSSAFEKEMTNYDTFYNDGNKAVSIPMMHQQEMLMYAQAEGYQAVKLYYGYDMKFSMTLFMPDLTNVWKPFTAERWENIEKAMQRTGVKLSMPRFKTNSDLALVDAMKALGMQDAFDAMRADFSLMSPMELFVSNIKQLAHIDVDEDGTIAAAATVIAMEENAVHDYSTTMTINHPFYFTIEDNETSTILFMGHIRNIVENTGESAAIASTPQSVHRADAPVFDLTGRQLSSKPQHGFYIQNGRKHFK